MNLLIGCLISLFLVSTAHAAPDWTDSFEYANDAAMRAVWPASQLDCTWGGPTPSSDRAFSGKKSAKHIFRGSAGIDTGAGGCFATRDLLARSDTLYTRWYMFMENFTVNFVGTKITRHEDTLPGYPGIWWGMPFGNANIGAAVEGVILDNGTQSTQNVNGGAIPQNQWVCIETFLSMGTPGVDNGIVRAWINGTQVLNKTNQRMRSATLIQHNGPNVKFGRIKMYTQHGVGVYYIDDYAVSRDAKIGCSGKPIPDTTHPAIPSNLVAE